MATYTSLINSVLTRLRESQVAAPDSTDYSLLIGEFVNESKEEVENAHKWSMLKQVITVTTVVDQASYSVVGSGKRWKKTDPNRYVLDRDAISWVPERYAPAQKRDAIANDVSNGNPTSFYWEGVDGNGDSIIHFYQKPNKIIDIDIDLVVPQLDFVLGTEVLLVPDKPVILGAYSKAIAERGEDAGRDSGEVEARYRNSMADEIAIDNTRSLGEDEWYNG